MARWAALLLAGTAAAFAPDARAVERVVLVPFESVARRGDARDVVMPAVEAALEAKGYQVVSGARVEDFLRARRIRFLDSLPAAHVRDVLEELASDAVVVGSVLTYDERVRDPVVTLAVRVVAPGGEILWTNISSEATSMARSAFGRRQAEKVEDLARRVVTEVLAPLPAPGRLSPVRPEPPTFPQAPRVYRSADLLGQRLTICVLPLQNLTRAPGAARVLDAVLQHRLSARPEITTVQPGDLRAAIVKAKLRAPAILSLEQLRELSDALGTSLFLRGTILAYGGPDPSGAAAPIELYLTLIEARSGRIMWSGLHRRAGSDYETWLRFGAIRDDPTLAGQVVAEMLDAFTRRISTMEAE